MSFVEKIKRLEKLISNNVFGISFKFIKSEKQELNEIEKKALQETGFHINWVVKIHYTVRKENKFITKEMILGYGDTLQEAIDNAITNKKWIKIT